jgi:hypothetical protein
METINEKTRLILGSFTVNGSLELRLESGKRIPSIFWEEPHAEELMLAAEVALLKWAIKEYPHAEVDNNMLPGSYGVLISRIDGHEVPRNLLGEFLSRSQVEGDIPVLSELPEILALGRALSRCCGEGVKVVGRFQAVEK